MTNVRLINHSSVLIQEGSEFILTDPWFEKPAFGSWLPVPPTSIPPAYLISLAKSCNGFTIVISHGHDDHLDDDFLSMFPRNISIVIPKYHSPGLLKRLQRIGFEKIIEAPTEGIKHRCFKICSYINMSISRDDAILTIETPESFIIHANDNWQEIEGANLEQIRDIARTYEPEHILYMSQCNLADGWPNIYTSYTEPERKYIHESRVKNIVSGSLFNADKIGARYFLNYAGYAAAFIKGNSTIRKRGSFKTNQYVEDIRKENNYNLEVLDILPGDCFDFTKIQKMFPGIELDPDDLKQSSYEFYESQGQIDKCDTYMSYENMPCDKLRTQMDQFLSGFSSFAEARAPSTGFNEDIVGFKVSFESSDSKVISTIVVGGNGSFNGREVKFSASSKILSELLRGKLNWENLYIGYAGTVEVEPKDVNIRAVVRWLAMYGYVYQRDAHV